MGFVRFLYEFLVMYAPIWRMCKRMNKKFLTLPSEYLWLLKNTEKKLLLSELKRRAEVLS